MVEKKTEEATVSRRKFLRDAGIGVGGAVIGAAIAYPLAPGKVKEVSKEVPVEVTKEVEVPKYVCPYCQEEFAKFGELTAHVEAEHPRVGGGGGAAIINMQVAGAESLKPVMDELDKRAISATIWLSGQEIKDNCDYVKALAERHEIGGKYLDQIEPETTYEDQKAKMEAMIEAAPECVGRRIAGFRAKRFTSNEHTYKLLEELGFEYLVESISGEQILADKYRPYPFPGHDFYIFPMSKAYTPVLNAFQTTCDTASQGDLTAEEFQQMEIAAIDHHIRLGELLVLEWHPSLTNPGDTEGWWNAFLAILDHLESKKGQVTFMTCRNVIDHYFPC